MINRKIVILVALLLAAVSTSVLAGNYAVNWYSIDSGGGLGASTSYKVNASVGQPIAGFTEEYESASLDRVWSGEVPVPTVAPTIHAAKLLADHTFVSVAGKIATSTEADFPGFFYLEEFDRSSGIRVAFPAGAISGIARGMSVINVLGSMDTTPAGERQIAACIIVITSAHTFALGPMGMANRSIGGSNFGAPPLGQYGITGGTGLNNVGLFVKIWGRVSYVDSTMLISDGSGQTVQVDTSSLAALPLTNDYIGIIGISSLQLSGGNRLPLLLPLNSVDKYYP